MFVFSNLNLHTTTVDQKKKKPCVAIDFLWAKIITLYLHFIRWIVFCCLFLTTCVWIQSQETRLVVIMLLLRLQYIIVDTNLIALWTNKCVKTEYHWLLTAINFLRLQDSLVPSLFTKFPRGVVWCNMELGIGLVSWNPIQIIACTVIFPGPGGGQS